MSVCVCGYLTLPPQAPLLQTGPDALDPPNMLWVAAVVSTRTLVLQRLRVIHQACAHTHTHTLGSQSSHSLFVYTFSVSVQKGCMCVSVCVCLTGGEACFGGVWGEGLVWQDERGGGGGGVGAGEGPVDGAPAVHHGYG